MSIDEGGKTKGMIPNQSIDSNLKKSHITSSNTNADNELKSLKNNMGCNQMFGFKQKGLHVSYLNIQHLLPKMDEIKLMLCNSKLLDIFCLSETFLNCSVEESCIRINGFKIERKDRTGKLGGGLVVYVSNNMHYRRRADLELGDLECIWLEIKFPHNKPLLLNFTYRPPNSGQNWIDVYENQFIQAENSNMEFILLGDFNINFSLSGTFNNSKWSKLIQDFGLHQHIKTPTRITKNLESIIDHIYSTCPHLRDAYS